MADNEINVVITASDKASNIIAGVSKTMKMVVNTISDITSEYIAYGDEVKKLATFTGMQADETSRMIQLADDAFVEFDTLRMAAKYMSDKGIAPNIENMAKLSDEFLKIQDPLAQSQFLIDNFSRAGMDMGNIMSIGGDKIKEMGEAINENLIMTPEKLKGIQEGKVALDNFNDSLTGMKYEIAGKLLEIFQQMPKPLQDVVLGIGLISSSGGLDSLASLFIIFGNIGKLGPALTTLGTTTLPAIGTALAAVSAPVWLLIAAIALLGVTIAVFGKDAANTASNILSIFKMLPLWIGLRIKEIADKFKAIDWAGLGKSIIYGIGAGIASAATWLWELVARIARGIWNSIMGALGGGGQSQSSGSGGRYPGRALGGAVTAGVTYIVGEHGPEPFTPSQNGTIMPNETLSAMSSGRGGNNTFILEYKPMISLADRAEVENKFGPIVRNIMRSA
jgi:hypothetical protein